MLAKVPPFGADPRAHEPEKGGTHKNYGLMLAKVPPILTLTQNHAGIYFFGNDRRAFESGSTRMSDIFMATFR